MAQTRFINFGDSLLSSRVNSIATSLVEASVLEGAALTVGSSGNTVSISPHTVMLGSVLLKEDAITTIEIASTLPSSVPTDYTIVYEHANQEVQGGVSAVLLIKSGLINFNAIPDTVVLGWIRWTGTGSALSANMLIEAPKLKIANPLEFPVEMKIPPFVSSATVSSIYVRTESSPGSIIQGDVFVDSGTLELSLNLSNPTGAVQTIDHLFPFVAGDAAPRHIFLDANVETGAKITVALLASDGTLFSLPVTEGDLLGTGSVFTLNDFLVPNIDVSKFEKSRKYFVSLTTELGPGTQVFIAGVGTSTKVIPV